MKFTSLRSLLLCLGLAAVLYILPAIPVQATQPLAEVQLHTDGLLLQPILPAAGHTLTVRLPDGTVLQKVFSADETPAFLLQDLEGGAADGTYTYQLTATPKLALEERTHLRARRALEDPAVRSGRTPSLPVQSGYFGVLDGAILVADAEEGTTSSAPSAETPSGGLQALPAADQLINDDLIVFFNECIGSSCVNGESFGSDSLRFKEANNRIHFWDTSIGAFPTTDWRIVVNSDVSGGASFFAVEDADAGRQVFTIEAGTRANALYVDNAGRVGLGTATPVEDLHMRTGDTPTLRLEQDSSGSFTPQTWNIAGNETNFFVQDVTSGSNVYPFRIRPGAPTSSLDIGATGNVGFGTASPAERLHVVGTNDPKVLIEDTADNANDKTGFTLRSPAAASSGDWTFEVNNNGNFQIDFGPSSGPELLITDTTGTNGTVTISGNLVVNGTCTGCDAVFQPGFELESVEDHAAFMFEHSHLPAVGPTPEGNTPIDVYQKTTGILQELEKAHIYIAQLHEQRSMDAVKLEALQQQNQQLLQRLERLEASLAAR